MTGAPAHRGQTAEVQPARQRDLVVVGASAGGVEALKTLTSRLPADLPATVLVSLHLPASARSHLSDILAHTCPLPVRHARDGMTLVPGEVVVAHPDAHLLVVDDRIVLGRGAHEHGSRPAHDAMLRAAALARGPRVVAAVLTGLLDDGAAGLATVQRYGGHCLVQDPGEADFPSMPLSALRAVPSARCLPLQALAEDVVHAVNEVPPPEPTVPEEQRQRDLAELQSALGRSPAMPDGSPTGEPSPYGCPECHGVPHPIPDPDLLRFRCRTGHAWSAESLVAQQDGDVEEALWMALRVLEERAEMSRRLAEMATTAGRGWSQEHFLGRAADAARSADLLRRGAAAGGRPADAADARSRPVGSPARPEVRRNPPVPDDVLPDEGFEALLVYLRDQRGADFTGYKRPSLTRLVNRRMRTAGVQGYAAYVDLLQVEPSELAALLDVLLINVTAVFRDPDAWSELAATLLPQALATLDPQEPIRVWSAACATGEEAYSLAMLLHAQLGDEEYKRRVKIYATDIDEQALATARLGRYSPEALEPLSPAQRDTYFEPDGSMHRFRSDLRPTLVFGRHDLLQDAPISRVVLLSCRNVLMYFTAETQTRVLERFAFALHEHGVLLLGRAEMLLTQSQLFTPVNLAQRIFRPRSHEGTGRLAALAVGGPGREVTLRRAAEAAFVAAPAAQVVLDSGGTVVLLNARAQRDLGLSQRDVGRLFHELELSHRPLELRGSVAAVQASRQPVELRDVTWTPPMGAPGRWDIRIAPLTVNDEAQGMHLVFEDVSDRHQLRVRLGQLDGALTTAYEELQSSSEELETTNEELQSAVEELETTNEELQSTNEELETMNEELQSTNEELQSLNDELRDRTLEVDRVNGLLHGILTGLQLAVVVVDAEYRVQLWNGAAERLTGLRSFEAEGRRLLELAVDLPADQVRAALHDVVVDAGRPGPVDIALTDRFGRARLRRLTVTPLQRPGGAVLGAVVTLADTPPATDVRADAVDRTA